MTEEEIAAGWITHDGGKLPDAAYGRVVEVVDFDDMVHVEYADDGEFQWERETFGPKDEVHAYCVKEYRIFEPITPELTRLRSENERLKQQVVTFCAPWAGQYAHDYDFPPKHLHPTHYDILASCGARMDDFIRADIQVPTEKEPLPLGTQHPNSRWHKRAAALAKATGGA